MVHIHMLLDVLPANIFQENFISSIKRVLHNYTLSYMQYFQEHCIPSKAYCTTKHHGFWL